MSEAKTFSKEQQLAGHTKKRYRRKVAGPKQWAALRSERLGPCLVCRYSGIEMVGPIELHHVVSRGRGGDDVAVNLVSLCRPHHERVTLSVPSTCQSLAAAIQAWEPATYAYAVEKLGEDGWLREYYVQFGGAK